MQPDFRPPKNRAEIRERAKSLTIPGIRAVLSSLKQRRVALVDNIDKEIDFYEKALEIKLAEEVKNA